MKCNNCPLYTGWSIESYNGIEDNGVTCGLFGDGWDSEFQYEKDGCVIGCYIDRHFIEAQAKTVKRTVTELYEAKQLLKAAVEDIHELLCDRKNLEVSGQGCSTCSYIDKCSCCRECTINEDLRNWRYADEALKLIGNESESVNKEEYLQ